MHVVVVGGGVAGLSAARQLVRGEDVSRVTLLEAATRVGGKLRSSLVAGQEVDEGAEQVLVRRPEALDLLRAVGLGDDVVHPRTSQAAVWARGRLRALPTRTVVGVPTDLATLARSGVLSGPGIVRAALDRVLPRTSYEADVPVGQLVAARLGREVVDRLVDPLLGGVYAGRADDLSVAATLPALAQTLRGHRSLLAAARAARAGAGAEEGAAFASLRGSLSRLAEAALTDTDVVVRTRSVVRGLHRTTTGFRVVVGDTRSPEAIEAAAVVVAVPAAPAARLLGDVAPGAAAELAQVDYASVAIVTLAYPRAAVPAHGISGYLVPATERRSTKAVTFTSAKWAHLDRGEHVIVRASIGRYGATHELQRDDDDLVAVAAQELLELAGVTGRPTDTRVSRWGGGLPQYRPGHLELVGRVRAALPPGIAVCGAAYDGVGVPACIGSGRDAATRVLDGLRQSTGGRQEEGT